jgi:hypothetical protein
MAKKKKDLKRLIQRTSSDNVEVLDVQVELFIASLRSFLFEHYRELFAEIKGKSDSEVVERLGGLFTGLKKAGLEKELGKLEKLYSKELDKVKESFKDTAKTKAITKLKTIVDRDTVEGFIRFGSSEVTDRVNVFNSDIRTAVLEQVVLGNEPDLTKLKEKFDSSLGKNLKTELRTGLMNFHRTVAKVQAEKAGLTYGYYAGVILDNTRDFCRELLEERDPPIYSLEEIEEMDNEQGLDVVTSGGGYNCTHHWRWIDEQTAKDLGYEPEDN